MTTPPARCVLHRVGLDGKPLRTHVKEIVLDGKITDPRLYYQRWCPYRRKWYVLSLKHPRPLGASPALIPGLPVRGAPPAYFRRRAQLATQTTCAKTKKAKARRAAPKSQPRTRSRIRVNRARTHVQPRLRPRPTPLVSLRPVAAQGSPRGKATPDELMACFSGAPLLTLQSAVVGVVADPTPTTTGGGERLETRRETGSQGLQEATTTT